MKWKVLTECLWQILYMDWLVNEYGIFVFILRIFPLKIVEYKVSSTRKFRAFVMNETDSQASVIHNETKFVRTRAWLVVNRR